MSRTERYEAIVIGAGQAGLAAGYWLAKHDVDFLIVDANARVGDVWRNRWDSLRLFTPARYSALPGMRFPGDPYHLPSRTEVADYLEWYAQANDLPIRTGVRVRQVRRADAGFEVDTDGVQLQADNVIIATGAFQTPVIPGISQQLDPGIMQLHSSGYRNPRQLPDGDALVVGAANSGAQIALEISRARNTLLAGRSVGSMPRRVLGRDLFDWLWPTVMRPGADSAIGRRIQRDILSSTDKLIGMSEADLDSPSLKRVGRVVGVREGKPQLEDGSVASVKSIVWCTGFRPDFRWIDAPVFDDGGTPRHTRGVTAVPGLYFLGLRFLYRLNSSLIGGVGADAEFVASALASRYGASRPSLLSPAA
ncbi:MAG TPA: NAD(P)-binding domain-containing protein [Gemmatimonadaceae bacterium]|nr:NAD(P)-binding domain-containing protein [Gemmatimonadaceae bacterium]